MKEPALVVYGLVLLGEESEATVYQFGAFTCQAEAKKVLDRLDAECVTDLSR